MILILISGKQCCKGTKALPLGFLYRNRIWDWTLRLNLVITVIDTSSLDLSSGSFCMLRSGARVGTYSHIRLNIYAETLEIMARK